MIGQADLDQMANVIQAQFAGLMEQVTFYYRQYASSEAVAYGPITARVHAFKEGVFQAQALVPQEQQRVLRSDREIRMATAALPIAPTIYSYVIRANEEIWRICPYEGAVQGGPGQTWWKLHVRRHPGS